MIFDISQFTYNQWEKVRPVGGRIDRREAKQRDVRTDKERIEAHASRQVQRQT